MDGVLVELGAVPAVSRSMVLIAEQAPPPGKGAEFGEASPVGLVVVLLLAVATVFLIRSMSKRIRRLPASFDPPEQAADVPATDEPPTDEAAEGQPRSAPAAGRDAEDAGGRRG